MEAIILGKALLLVEMARVYFLTKLEIYTLVAGRMIAFMDRESICFQVDKFMMACSITIKSRVSVHTTMIMPPPTIQETGFKI